MADDSDVVWMLSLGMIITFVVIGSIIIIQGAVWLDSYGHDTLCEHIIKLKDNISNTNWIQNMTRYRCK